MTQMMNVLSRMCSNRLGVISNRMLCEAIKKGEFLPRGWIQN